MRTLATIVFFVIFSLAGAAAKASLTDRTYRVQVISHDGQTRFTDCLTFGSKGSLVIAGAHMPLIWVEPLGSMAGTSFAATNPGAQLTRHAFGLAVHGMLSRDAILTGSAINEYGTSFSLAGYEDKHCLYEPAGAGFATAGEAPPGGKPEPIARLAASAMERVDPRTSYRPPPLGDRQFPDRIRTFRISLYDVSWRNECWHFDGNGRFWNDAGLEQVWAADSPQQHPETLQTVGIPKLKQNLAIYGRVFSWGGLEFDGISSDADGTRAITGYGHPDSNCSVY